MSATGLEVFDKTLQTTNIWLNEISDEIDADRRRAYRALRAVLHALRDRLTVHEAAHLGAQLPLLVRGIYYDSWRPQLETSRERKQEQFLAHVAEELKDGRAVTPEQAVRAVFATVARHVSPGQADEVRTLLPQDIRALWPEPATT